MGDTTNSEVNLEKHVVCEPCGPTVSGGFDPEHRQVGRNTCSTPCYVRKFPRLFCAKITSTHKAAWTTRWPTNWYTPMTTAEWTLTGTTWNTWLARRQGFWWLLWQYALVSHLAHVHIYACNVCPKPMLHTHIHTYPHNYMMIPHTHTYHIYTHIQSYNVQHRSGLRALVESASSGKKHLQGLSLVGRHTIRFARDTKGCGHVVMEITYPIVLSCFVGVCTREGHQVHLVCQEHHWGWGHTGCGQCVCQVFPRYYTIWACTPIMGSVGRVFHLSEGSHLDIWKGTWGSGIRTFCPRLA